MIEMPNLLQARVGNWVLVCFPADESGKNRKLSHPWHGPFFITEINDPEMEASNIYFPQDPRIMIHQLQFAHVTFYWYGGRGN